EHPVSPPQLLGRDRSSPPQQPALRDQPHERTRRERAPAEAEDVDLVAVHVLLHEPVVGVADVLRKPEAEGAAREGVEHARAHAGLVVHVLYPAVRDGAFAHRVREVVDVRARIALVPRPVQADDETLAAWAAFIRLRAGWILVFRLHGSWAHCGPPGAR